MPLSMHTNKDGPSHQVSPPAAVKMHLLCPSCLLEAKILVWYYAPGVRSVSGASRINFLDALFSVVLDVLCFNYAELIHYWEPVSTEKDSRISS
jgi:hypothetical protein